MHFIDPGAGIRFSICTPFTMARIRLATAQNKPLNSSWHIVKGVRYFTGNKSQHPVYHLHFLHHSSASSCYRVEAAAQLLLACGTRVYCLTGERLLCPPAGPQAWSTKAPENVKGECKCERYIPLQPLPKRKADHAQLRKKVRSVRIIAAATAVLLAFLLYESRLSPCQAKRLHGRITSIKPVTQLTVTIAVKQARACLAQRQSTCQRRSDDACMMQGCTRHEAC